MVAGRWRGRDAARLPAAYRSAATDMLDRCQPLPLTAGLGGAIAGRPFIISIIDDRIDDRKDTKDDIHEH
ncbi:MAG TPA: hypothetical protein VGP86_13290 [Xanthobacteraceae bacterium]|jgi:hypothetical protein|nr:hypothetical protein [Xanthobacteraceae bacterium]